MPRARCFPRLVRRSHRRFRPMAHFGRLVAGRTWQQDEWDLEIRFHLLRGAERFARKVPSGAVSIVSITTRRAEAGLCAEFTTDVHRTPRALRLQLSRRRLSPEELAGICARTRHARHGLARSRRRLRLAALSSGGRKTSIRAHIGAEVTSTAGWRYPLLVESRAGYQNLCRLITRMKLRARKGEGSVAARRNRRAESTA